MQFLKKIEGPTAENSSSNVDLAHCAESLCLPYYGMQLDSATMHLSCFEIQRLHCRIQAQSKNYDIFASSKSAFDTEMKIDPLNFATIFVLVKKIYAAC